jgi:RNA polymerase sigma-70 factor (ECF subfamily)
MAERTERQRWFDEARQGDPLAVSKLLACHFPVLRAHVAARMARELRTRLEPEDVLQEVYLDAHRQIEHFRDCGEDALINWLLTIADSKVIDAGRALRRKKRDAAREVHPHVGKSTQSYLDLLDQVYADSITPSRIVRREEGVGALMACVSRLSETHRQVIQWRYLEGRSVADVADRLGKSEAAVVALTGRAVEGLRRCMDGLGEFTRSL